MSSKEGKGGRGLIVGAVVLGGGLFLLIAAVITRLQTPAPPLPPPAPVRNAPSPVLTRVMDEGSLTRESPEEKFLDIVSKGNPRVPLTLNGQDQAGESKRILGDVRKLFAKMRELADKYKKSDPAKYAAEMELLKEELTQLFRATRTILKEWDIANQELFRMIREETDSVVKERLGYLLRFAKRDQATTFAVGLAESSGVPDRKVAIAAMSELRTLDAVKGLIQHAAVDSEMELRQRSIIGLGKSLSRPSPDYKQYQEAGWTALRQYADPANPAPLRAAVFEAYVLTPELSEPDRDLILKTIRTEKDPAVLKPAQSAHRHLAARSKGASDQMNTQASPQ